MSHDSDRALDVIGKRLKLLDEINKDFDEMQLRNVDFSIENPTTNGGTSKISYRLSSKDIGFNVLCQLNLGKAYQMIEGRRVKYPTSDKEAMNEKWLDYCLDGIRNASNPVVIITDIFTRVTTGNYENVLPYEEQLGYIYSKLSDPKIKDKIIILARGSIEQSIINNGGPDLMLRLGNMLNMPERVTNGGTLLTATINNSHTGEVDRISFAHVDKKINSRNPLAKAMKAFAAEHPGHDVYYSTNSKQNWWSAGVTTYKDEKGVTREKTCWFVSFGPMFEYDRFNLNRPELGPYTLNKNWYKVFTDEESNVRMEYVNYIFPVKDKQDTSDYVASVVTDALTASYQDLIDACNATLGKFVEKDSKRARKQVLSAITKAKEQAKQTKTTTRKSTTKKVPRVKQEVVEETKKVDEAKQEEGGKEV